MARRALTFALWLSLSGCGDPPTLEIDAPLLVFNSYPANGATLLANDLGEVALTFSANLGAAEAVRGRLANFIELADRQGVIDLVREDQTNVAYDEGTFTLRVLIAQELRSVLAPGPYDLRVYKGLEAADGTALAADFSARFRLAE